MAKRRYHFDLQMQLNISIHLNRLNYLLILANQILNQTLIK